MKVLGLHYRRWSQPKSDSFQRAPKKRGGGGGHPGTQRETYASRLGFPVSPFLRFAPGTARIAPESPARSPPKGWVGSSRLKPEVSSEVSKSSQIRSCRLDKMGCQVLEMDHFGGAPGASFGVWRRGGGLSEWSQFWGCQGGLGEWQSVLGSERMDPKSVVCGGALGSFTVLSLLSAAAFFLNSSPKK